MSNDNARLFDDLTRVAGGAVSVLSALGKQMGAGLQEQVGKNFGVASGASSDDVERLQGVVTKLRLEQEDLKTRIAALESLLGVKMKTSSKKAAPKAKMKPPTKTKISTAKKAGRK